MKLREYQRKYLTSLVNGFPEKRQPLIHLATGGGKSILFKKCAELALKKNKKVLFIVHGKTILEQAVKKHFSSISSDISFMQGSQKYRFSEILCASIDTLSRRKKIHDKILSEYDMYIVDEAHEATSKKYRNFLDKIPREKWVIGFSATPYMVGKKGHTYWSNVIKEISALELVKQGYLMNPKIFSAPVMSAKVKTVAGDFNNKQLFEQNDKLKIYSDVLKEYELRAKGLRALCFAINRTHAKNLCDAFNKKGHKAEYADGETSQQDRAAMIERLENGKTLILCNVDVFSTGVDIPKIECGLMCRPTKSRNKWIQQVGRVLRPDPSCRACIILDFGGNCTRPGVGHPLEDFEADVLDYDELEKKKKTEKDEAPKLSIRTCPSCFFILENPNVELCPECGEPVKTTRQIAQEKEAELVEIERALNFKKIKKPSEEFVERYIKMEKVSDVSSFETISEKDFLIKLLKGFDKGFFKKNFIFFEVWRVYGEKSLNYMKYPSWFKEKVGIREEFDLSLLGI